MLPKQRLSPIAGESVNTLKVKKNFSSTIKTLCKFMEIDFKVCIPFIVSNLTGGEVMGISANTMKDPVGILAWETVVFLLRVS